MKKIVFYILTLFAAGVYFTGCDPFEEYESSDVLPQPAATLSVSAVADSSFTLDISTDKSGILGYVVTRDTALNAAAISILSKSLEGSETFAFEEESGGSKTINIGGLMPNTYYKVHAASMNKDGVESDVETTIVKTDDGVGPTFKSSVPAISNQATVAAGTAIVLTFDEPVKVDTNKTFTFTYYYEGVTAEVSLNNSNVSGNQVTVPQSHTGHAGDYFFLSWEAGAVTDLSNNPTDERVSGVIDGSLKGNYYRFEKIPFSVADKNVVPENDSILAAHDFVVDIHFPFEIELSDELTSEMVKFKYTSWLGTVTTEVSAFNNAEVVNDTTLRITQPRYAENGDNIALYLAEGVVLDNYGNVNEASDYELSWDLGDFTVPMAFEPAMGSVVTNQMFNVSVKFDFPVSVVTGPDAGAVTMTYVEDNGNENTYDVTTYGIDADNDSVLIMQTPQEVNFGSTVSLNIGENVVQDTEGNVNLELQEVIYWEVPKLAASIDVLVGQYIVSGISYFDDALVSDTITIELNEDTPNSVTITGFFGMDKPVTGIYDPENSLLSIAEQVIGSGEDRNYTVFSNETDDGTLYTYVLEDGTMNSDLALGVYDGSMGWLGFGEYMPETTWTKIQTKSAKINFSTGEVVKRVGIKSSYRNIN